MIVSLKPFLICLYPIKFQMNYSTILIDQHKELGQLSASFKWASCGQVNNDFYRLKHSIESLKREIRVSSNNCSVFMEEDELQTLLADCSDICQEEQLSHEALIAERNKPTELFFNPKALIIYTRKAIPKDILIGLSFGYKFLFPFPCTQHNLHELLAQLEMTLDGAVPDLQQLEGSVEIRRILRERNPRFSGVIAWLRFVAKRSAAFFAENPDIVPLRSDKGAHTVIMDVPEYYSKLDRILADNVYVNLRIDPHMDPLLFLSEKELLLVESLKQLKFFPNTYTPSFQPNVSTLAKFYGLPKIHKTDTPLRPITSTINAPGYYLAKVFFNILDTIFPRTPFHVKDSYQFVHFLRQIKLNPRDILVSFDVISMYTSIPFDLAFKIIMRKADLFLTSFGINQQLLSDILIFLLQECSIFTARDCIYKQKDGLPMGSCLSPLIARIVMDEVIGFLLQRVSLTFIQVFVDDTIAAVNVDLANEALTILNSFAPGQIIFTMEHENDTGSINFLNVTLTREADSVFTNWYRKPYASGRLLNFYSSHKRTTILATGAHFIKTVLLLSDPRFFHQNTPIIINTLRENSFSELTIMTLMNTFYTFMRHTDRVKTEQQNADNKYVIFPYAVSHSKNIRGVISRLKSPNITLADSVRNTKVNFVRTLKPVGSLASGGNVILSSQCKCKKRCIVQTPHFNENGEMAINRLRSPLQKDCDNSGHAYDDFQLHRGLYYKNQSRFLLRYVQWMHIHKLDMLSHPYHFPLYHFGQLIKCKCCTH